jgi:hypothetical protein
MTTLTIPTRCAIEIFPQGMQSLNPFRPVKDLVGITPVMWSRQEFVFADLPILIGVQGIKTFLATHPWSTLSALTLTATLGKCHTCDEEHCHQPN